MIDSTNLIEFFAAEYAEEVTADEIKKGISEDMKSFAESNNVNPKAIKCAYALYKKFKSGKNTSDECADYTLLSDIVETFFANGGDE